MVCREQLDSVHTSVLFAAIVVRATRITVASNASDGHFGKYLVASYGCWVEGKDDFCVLDVYKVYFQTQNAF